MRTVQVLAFVVFSALLVAGGAWALAWWGTPRPPDPIEAGLEARPEIKSPGGFAPSIIPVEIEPAQRGASVKFAPDPVFAALEPAHKAKTKPARAAASRVAPPRDAQEETSSDGLVSRGWKYLEQKAQNWQMQLGRLIYNAESQ